MLARLRSFLLKTPVKIVLGLAAAWLLFGWFAFGPLAQWGAERFIAAKTGHRLSLERPEFDPVNLRLTLRNLRLTEPDGKPLAGFKELFVDFEASSLLRFAWTFDAIRLAGPEGNVVLLPGGRLNWSAFLDAFKDEKEEPDKPLPRLLIRHFELKDGRLAFTDRTVAPAYATGFQPLDLTLDDLSTLPDDKGAYQVAARTALGGRLRWQGDVGLKPVAVSGAFSLEGVKLAQVAPYLKGRVDIAAPQGTAGISTRYRVGYDKKKLSLSLEQLGASVEGLRLAGAKSAEPALALDRIVLSGGRFDLDQRRFSLAAFELTGGKVILVRRPDGRLNLQEWFPESAAPAAAEADSSLPRRWEPSANNLDSRVRGNDEVKAHGNDEAKGGGKDARKAEPWNLDLGRFSLDGVAVRVLDQTFAKPLALDVGRVKVGFKASARVGAGPVQAKLEEGGVSLGRIAVASAGKPVLGLERIALEGIGADVAARHAQAARLALEGGRLNAARAADGRIALLDAFAPAHAAKPAAKAAAPARNVQSGKASGWTWKLGRAEINGFQAALRDETVQPAAALDLEASASAAGLSQNLAAAVPVKLGLRLRQGGSLQVQGKLVPAKGALDAQVNLAGLALAPAQPYIAQAAKVTLVSGQAASQGRLKIGDKIRYQGGFSVTDLLVNEAETGNRVLAWQRLATEELNASPEAVEIGEVKVDGLGLKLVIDKERVLNLKRLMKEQHVDPAVAAAPPKADAKELPAKPGMKFAIERVTVSANEMDFADESLALPFGTRIHSLKGTVNGISLVKGKPAQMELDGQVDDYGLARAVGQIDFLDPTGYTDIKVVFRNVEMARLTPYSATFAGRRIESGKLSLDLEYKIKQRQLEGDNKVIMDKLTLGERIESASAKNLPLDLAIAILQDSDGVIDLGLPVSGNLDDPQFSYGGIIWKAIVNVITKVALAPFRAIGKLLGISGDKLEHIAFDAGEARLLPPERDKLRQLASALAKRPNLALTATPAWNPLADRLAVKEDRLRRAVAEASGRKLAPGEDPGPVSTAQAKVQEALEKLYAARIGAEALKTLKAKFAQANPEPPPTSTAGKLLSRLSGLVKAKPEPLSAAEEARLKGADLHALIYQALLDKETVADADLVALAQARAEAIRAELAAAGVTAGKLTVNPVEQAAGEGREVAVKLGLGVARKVGQ